MLQYSFLSFHTQCRLIISSKSKPSILNIRHVYTTIEERTQRTHFVNVTKQNILNPPVNIKFLSSINSQKDSCHVGGKHTGINV